MQIKSSDSQAPYWEFLIQDSQKPEFIVSKCPVIWKQRAHIAVSFDGGKYRFFVDGQLQGQVELEKAYLPSSMPFLIGAGPHRRAKGMDYNTHDHFRGAIEEVRITKSACYLTDFKPTGRLTISSDTVLLYHLDEGNGDIASDASGSKRHGIIKGGAEWNHRRE